MPSPNSIMSTEDALKYLEQLGVDIRRNALYALAMCEMAIRAGLIRDNYTCPALELFTGKPGDLMDDLKHVANAADLIGEYEHNNIDWLAMTDYPLFHRILYTIAQTGQNIAHSALCARMKPMIDEMLLSEFYPKYPHEVSLVKIRGELLNIQSDLAAKGLRVSMPQLAEYRRDHHM